MRESLQELYFPGRLHALEPRPDRVYGKDMVSVLRIRLAASQLYIVGTNDKKKPRRLGLGLDGGAGHWPRTVAVQCLQENLGQHDRQCALTERKRKPRDGITGAFKFGPTFRQDKLQLAAWEKEPMKI